MNGPEMTRVSTTFMTFEYQGVTYDENDNIELTHMEDTENGYFQFAVIPHCTTRCQGKDLQLKFDFSVTKRDSQTEGWKHLWQFHATTFVPFTAFGPDE